MTAASGKSTKEAAAVPIDKSGRPGAHRQTRPEPPTGGRTERRRRPAGAREAAAGRVLAGKRKEEGGKGGAEGGGRGARSRRPQPGRTGAWRAVLRWARRGLGGWRPRLGLGMDGKGGRAWNQTALKACLFTVWPADAVLGLAADRRASAAIHSGCRTTATRTSGAAARAASRDALSNDASKTVPSARHVCGACPGQPHLAERRVGVTVRVEVGREEVGLVQAEEGADATGSAAGDEDALGLIGDKALRTDKGEGGGGISPAAGGVGGRRGRGGGGEVGGWRLSERRRGRDSSGRGSGGGDGVWRVAGRAWAQVQLGAPHRDDFRGRSGPLALAATRTAAEWRRTRTCLPMSSSGQPLAIPTTTSQSPEKACNDWLRPTDSHMPKGYVLYV
eukprot:scaffold4676_cov94-Isochrysis_galbana.AAC.5